MFGGRVYYIALALCLAAVGTIGYFALRERPVTVKQQEPAPTLDIQPTPTQPVVKPAPVVIPEPEPQPEITEPAELLPQVVSPLDGTTVTVFSMTELLYDTTMADWRTHDGIDVQAEEGAAVKTAAGGTVQSVTDDELMGTTVVIDHEGGYSTRYSSLQKDVPVTAGQQVVAGEVIGRVGTTSAAESQMGTPALPSSPDGAVIDPRDYVGSGRNKKRAAMPLFLRLRLAVTTTACAAASFRSWRRRRRAAGAAPRTGRTAGTAPDIFYVQIPRFGDVDALRRAISVMASS